MERGLEKREKRIQERETELETQNQEQEATQHVQEPVAVDQPPEENLSEVIINDKHNFSKVLKNLV